VVTRDEIRDAPSNVTVRHGIGPNSPELIALYQSSDIFALPTIGDCYSMVGMEALACGVPVVTSDIGGISDIVSEGKTGYLCQPGDMTTFTQHLDNLVSDGDLRNRMGIAARERAIERFDAAACARRLGDLMVMYIDNPYVMQKTA
jgi:glycosyltransferase involved in cell wall biosynthesis